MKQYPAKLKLIFLPFLFLSAATIVVYTFLHWLLFIKTVIVPVDEDILNFWGPMVFPGIPILIWLRPRIKLLNLKNKSGKGDPLGGFIFFLWIAMAVPVIIAQSYLVTASGKLTELDSISQISKLPATKYYKVKHYYIDKNLVAFSTRFTTSGKYNQNFDMYIYAAVPVFDVNRAVKTHHFKISSPHSTINSDNALIVVNGRPTSRDSLEKINPRAIKQITVLKGPQAKAIYGDDAKDGAILIQTNPFYKGPDTLSVVNDGNSSIIPDAWIGVKFEKTISNKLTPDQKQGEYEDFAKSSQKDFNAKKLDSFIYLDHVAYGEDQKGYLKAINKNDFYTSNNPRIILNTVNEPFEARNGQKLPWIFGSFAIGAVVFMLLLLIKPLRNGVDLQTEETNANV
ncbi:MAG: TonB-dependent receptor, partial [Mucilaginibacter sp.]